jgi:hypothetical protein
MDVKPWAEGPLELLKHAVQHLSLASEFDNRMAMISVDNAVELMIRTYLSLPKRITCIKGPSRKEFSEISQSFPSLLDAIERFAPDKIIGIELGDIEYYHRIRNQLYHDGNGVTVSKEHVQAYSEIGKALFFSLFVIQLEDFLQEEPVEKLGSFIRLWTELEHALIQLRNAARLISARDVYRISEHLASAGVLPAESVAQFRQLRILRNDIVHGMETPRNKELARATIGVQSLLELVKECQKNVTANRSYPGQVGGAQPGTASSFVMMAPSNPYA